MRQVAPFAVVGAVVVLLGVPTVIFPFGRDQGTYAYVADQLLAGRALYSEIYSFKPPMTALTHALSQVLFGHAMAAIRILDFLWTGLVALVVYAVGLRLFAHRLFACAAAVVFAFLYYSHGLGHGMGYWTLAQTDGWANLPAGAGFLAALMARESVEPEHPWRRIGSWAVSGALFGVAALYKYTFGAFFLVGFLVCIVGTHRRRARFDVTSLVTGFVVSLLILAAGLAWEGSLRAFLYTQWTVLFPYGGDLEGRTLLPQMNEFLGKLFGRQGLVTFLGVFGAGVAFVRAIDSVSKCRLAALAVLGWFGGALFSTYVQGKFFFYHYMPLQPPVALLALLPFHALYERLGPGRSRAMIPAGALLAAFLLCLDVDLRDHWKRYWQLSGDMTARVRWWSSPAFDHGDVSLEDNMRMATYLRRNTATGAPVFLWGYDPTVYFLAERPVVSRFVYTFPLVVPWAPDSFREELLSDLQETPPEVFVVSSGDATPWVTGHSKDSRQTFEEFAALQDFVEEDYVRETDVGRFRVYRHVNEQDEP